MSRGSTSRTSKAPGDSQGRRESEKGLTCLGYITVASVESLGQRAPMGSIGLVLQTKGPILSMTS